MVTPYTPGSDDLKRGIKHVCYEYANLISAAHWSLHGQPPWRTNVDDAFLLGYRKLRDFLLKDTRSKGKHSEFPDVLACDYTVRNRKRTWSLPTWDSKWRAVMDKQLAHISFERESEWDHRIWLPRLEGEMRTAWAAFLLALEPQHKLAFKAELARCRGKPGFRNLRL